MAHSASGPRAARKRARIAVLSISAAALAATSATPAVGQTIVFGDPGSRSCYEAAAFGDDSLHAISECTNAIESNTLNRRDRAATHHNRGIVHRMRGDLDQAMADYRESQRLAPDLPETHVSEGNLHFVTGEFARAVEAYERALSLGLNVDHVAHYNIGLANEQLGRLGAAERALLAAAASSPDWGLPRRALERVRELQAERGSTTTNGS